jgi:hypothetical protein
MKLSLLVLVIINVALSFNLFLINSSLTGIADEIGETSIPFDDSVITSFDKGNYTLDGSVSEAIQALPTDSGSSVDGDNNLFTDPLKSMKNWLLDTLGIRYVLNYLNAVPNAMSLIFPEQFKPIAFALGWIWHVLTVVTIITWFKGN